MGVLFVAATIQTASAMPELSCSEPAKLIFTFAAFAAMIPGPQQAANLRQYTACTTFGRGHALCGTAR